MIDNKEKRKRKHSSKDSNEVIHGKEKRKKKQMSRDKEDNACDNNRDKYLAYKKKSNNEGTSRSANSSLEKKSTNKVKGDVNDRDFDDDTLGSQPAKQKTNVVISAKPALNKNAILLPSKKSKVKVDKSFKGKVEVRGDVQLISPVVSLTSGFKIKDIKSKELPPVNDDLSNVNDELTRCTPMIIEAKLKKPARSYIPKCLLSDEESDVYVAKSDKTTKMKNEAAQISIESLNVTEQTNTSSVEQDSSSDMPKALEDFYNEVTKAFEVSTDKLPNTSKNHDKKTTTTDNAAKNVHSRKNIVQDISTLDKTSSEHKGDIAQFFSLENKVILVLKPETQFSFLGKLKIRVLYGAIEVYGSMFERKSTIKPIEVFSPRCYSSVCISTFNLEGTHDKEALWDILISEGVDRSMKTKLHDTIKECQPRWCVLLLENFENTLTNFLSNHCAIKVFPRLGYVNYPWCDSRRAECVLQANFQFSNSGNEISISPQWNKNVTRELLVQWNTKKSLRTMLIGGKSVGKSTTTRYLINNLLRSVKKVILLDFDPGQAEMTPASSVSLSVIDKPLLGPNFTHLMTPFYQLYLEDINVCNCITRYIECTKKLVECLNSTEDLAGYPVIINTMGFCKGIGLDICIFLIKLTEPTNVIQLTSKRSRNNFEFTLRKDIVNRHKQFSLSWDTDKTVLDRTCNYQLYSVPSMAEGRRQFNTWNVEPRQQREIVLLSYLSQIIQNANEKCFSSFISNSINNIVPYKLLFSSFYISLSKSSISPTHILAAMNGNIVALCGIDLEDNNINTTTKSTNYPKVVINPPPSTCYGYGIVRGIDMKQCCLFINTPLMESQLPRVNLLAGCSEIPFALLQPVFAEPSSAGPYSADRGELPTSREARRGYFRIEQSKNV